MRDKLTKREDRALLRALRELVLTQYPNPDRTGCPGTSIIKAIATKRISMLDPAHEHVANCSPCFKELRDIQRRLHRRNVLLWAVTTAASAAIILAIVLPYFGFGRNDIPGKADVFQEGRAESHSPAQPNVAVGTAPAVRDESTQPKYETALLDLRNASPVRSVERTNSDPNAARTVPRGLLTLLVELPIGSDAGSYEIQIRDSTEKPVLNAKSDASIENGITKLPVNVDTRALQPGQYQFAWRLVDFSWSQYPILIR